MFLLMKSFLIAVVVLFTATCFVRADAPCSTTVLAEVAIHGGDLFLSDLLSPDTCPDLRHAASRMRLGATPLAGSPRVLDGDAVRALLWRALPSINARLPEFSASIPARVVIRRGAGVCSFCSSPMRLSDGTSFDFLRRSWDPALHRWNIFARCAKASACVPFLLSSDPDLKPPTVAANTTQAIGVTASAISQPDPPQKRSAKPLVRPGQHATIIWDGSGIRLTAGAVSLDRGARGESVRARIVGADRVVDAVVWTEDELRVFSP